MILSNAGIELESINGFLSQIIEKGEGGSKPRFGVNVRTNYIVDMKESGVIDPTKVTRNALLNASIRIRCPFLCSIFPAFKKI